MDSIAKTSRSLIVVSLLSAIFVAGCNRGSSDQAPPATESPPAAGTTGTPPPAAAPGASGGTTPGADTSGKPSTEAGSALDDTTITTKVKTALLADPNVKGLDISVETQSGETVLSGIVDNQAQIDSALKTAQGVEGVKKVTNKMKVKAG
ncbi:MAG: BON domain-containing protein [Pseudomonadota bacterium]